MQFAIKIVHLVPALTAVLLGAFVLARPKGTADHKRYGRIWVALMYFVAATGLFIVGGPLEIYNGYGLIHLFSLLTIASLSVALWAIKTRRVTVHAISMTSTFIGLIGAGVAATLMPGRILHSLLFG